MDLNLRGRCAVVVGGARGIGRAIAAGFAAEGARAAIFDVDEGVDHTAKELHEEFGVATLGARVDVVDADAVAKAAERVNSEWGGADHVVFAVGIGSGKFGFPFWNAPPDDWARVLNVNVCGAVHVAYAFRQQLIDAKAGTLTFLASVAGQIGSQTDPSYSASKAALINFSQCAAKDFAPYGVRVNTVNPGMVKTALNQGVWQSWADQHPGDAQLTYDEWAADKIKKVVPLNRWQTPEDVANMVVFLASSAAHNVTGQTINVDGGFVMHW